MVKICVAFCKYKDNMEQAKATIGERSLKEVEHNKIYASANGGPGSPCCVFLSWHSCSAPHQPDRNFFDAHFCKGVGLETVF